MSEENDVKFYVGDIVPRKEIETKLKNMNQKYENLLERSVIAQERSNEKSDGMLKVSECLKDNLVKINDTFALHTTSNIDIKKEIKLIREELLKYLKWSIVALIIALGGQQIIKTIISNFM